MRIIVIADTHMPKRAKELPRQLMMDLRKADLIIHAGDWQTLELYEELAQYAQVVGVTGNVDGPDLREKLPDWLLMQIDGFMVGVVHGHGTGTTTEKRAMAAFAEQRLDCLIFGHSHIPALKQMDGMMLLNPGSPTDKRRQPSYSYAILTTTDSLHAELVFFESRL